MSLGNLRHFSRERMAAGLTLSLGIAVALLSATPADAQQYTLYKTKIVVHTFGDPQPQEVVKEGSPNESFDLQVISGMSQATGKVTVTVPDAVGAKHDQFTVNVKLDADFDLRGEAPTTNIAISANAMGRPAHKGKGDPEPWLMPGPYTLSLDLPVQTTFADEFIGTIVEEGTTTQRTINVKCHIGIVGAASSCDLTFYYLEEE